MQTPENSESRAGSTRGRARARECLVFAAFLLLAVVMTWPWARMLRDAVPDTGDPYLNAWIMWWDYHQTFSDPLNLFHSRLFYPYRYTLAFSEHNYGIALLFFPLYALGAGPLAVQGVATIVGFALCGYGAFRLARTLTGSTGAAWVAGIVFGFTPYRFHQLAHLNYLFSGWIPLVLEALVLYARRRTWKRAAWLGAAFLMNTLSCVHWFVLTLIPLALTAALLFTRYRVWRDRDLWLRGAVALGAAGVILLPFMLPYRRVAEMYGMVRDAGQATAYSATPGNWLTAHDSHRFWRGFGPRPETGERALFIGMLPLLLMLAALLFLPRRDHPQAPDGAFDAGASDAGRAPPPTSTPASEGAPSSSSPRRLLAALDALTVASLVVAALGYGYDKGVRLLWLEPLRVRGTGVPLTVFGVAFVARLCLAYPSAFRWRGDRNLIETVRAARRNEAFGVGLLWALVGFCGSLGMNFFFHRFLFEHVFLFRSVRVPARWAMIGHLGIALLAGLGALLFARALARRWPRLRPAHTVAFLCLLILFEQRAAPLRLARGEADPDGVSLYFKRTPMRGGIVHLPAGGVVGNYRYVLRQTDHARPVVTAVSGFGTPILTEVETLSQKRPVPARFIDLLEEIPASYLAVHNWAFTPDARPAVEAMLAQGLAEGRLRFVNSFEGTNVNGNTGADLYAVVRTEPDAVSEAPPPAHLAPTELGASIDEEPALLISEFERWGFPLYRLYRAAHGRMPRREEFLADARRTGRGLVAYAGDWERRLRENLRAFADEFAARPEFAARFAELSDEQYVSQLYANAGLGLADAERAALAAALAEGRETRAGVLHGVVAAESCARREEARALVLLHYFAFLGRDPDAPPDRGLDGFNFWLAEVEKGGDRRRLTASFMAAGEYRRGEGKK